MGGSAKKSTVAKTTVAGGCFQKRFLKSEKLLWSKYLFDHQICCAPCVKLGLDGASHPPAQAMQASRMRLAAFALCRVAAMAHPPAFVAPMCPLQVTAMAFVGGIGRSSLKQVSNRKTGVHAEPAVHPSARVLLVATLSPSLFIHLGSPPTERMY